MHDGNVYFAFMSASDCLLVVLASGGAEVTKKQFGVSGEVDVFTALAFGWQSIFLYGAFTG